MTTATMTAKERQLDWLLGEVLGGETPFGLRTARRAIAPAMPRPRWLAAALAVLAAGTALGVALLRREDDGRQAQEPQGVMSREIQWYEAHGPASIDSIPPTVVNLRCFDFDDAALVHIPHFAKLERLDLSGMDVNDRGYAVSLKITDAGLAHLAGVPSLRWLSLAGCHEVKGEGLRVLESLPMLEYLDLTYSGVESPAVERLALLVSLRELSLSHCMNFHGRSLAEVAKCAGLRRLHLQGCVMLSEGDAMHLGKLSQLRCLDLRDCQGRFRGQTESGFSKGGAEPPPPPVQDGIGITDRNVAALGKLPLESLLLGGSESLTDAIGGALAKMTTLRHLDLSNLPNTTGDLMAKIPDGLESLALDQNPQIDEAALARLPRLATLKELGLAGLSRLDGATLKAMLENKQLTTLRLGGVVMPHRVVGTSLRAADAAILASQKNLQTLDLARAEWIDGTVLDHIAKLPQLTELNLSWLDLSGTKSDRGKALASLAKSRTLRSLKLTYCEALQRSWLASLVGAPLKELDLYGTKLFSAHIREIAKAWPGCTIKMPDGQRYRVP